MDADPITLEVIRNRLEGIAEEMGEILVRSSYSPNIKERKDCSTAIFDSKGRMVAQAEHIPVHLGAMPEAVDSVLDKNPKKDDIFILNDPYRGGTHLPDITLVSPIVVDDNIVGYSVSRAHHADIGGKSPGSMPADSNEIYQEGIRIPPIRIVSEGSINYDIFDLITTNVRNSDERRADLQAQIGANKRAQARIEELDEKHELDSAFSSIIDYSQTRVKSEIEKMPTGIYEASDILEAKQNIEIKTTIDIGEENFSVDFTGTDKQIEGNLNAPLSVTKSSVYFVFRCIIDNKDIPSNHGCYEPVSVYAPKGSLLNPNSPSAVVGGNVETSQRIVDVVMEALSKAMPNRIPAQGQGTMNNLIIGNTDFTYYETIGGGSGARRNKDGMDGVHVGMTNTLNTPIESIETEYPLQVKEYSFRENSGGLGKYRGGLGLKRAITVKDNAVVSLLTERRSVAPKGRNKGNNGKKGRNFIDENKISSKTTIKIDEGSTVEIRTPGGGGYGDFKNRSSKLIKKDMLDQKTSQ